MAFKPGAGYGELFGYSVANIRGDGFEVPHLAGTILRTAIGQLVFTRFLNESRDAFGVGKGGTFTIPIFQDFGAVTSVTPLVPGTAIGLGTQRAFSVSMAMQEYGTGIAYESLGDWISSIEIRSQLVDTLGRHIGRMINFLDYEIFAATPWSIEVVAAGSYNGLLGTNRALVATAYGELGRGGVALAYDSLVKNLVPPVTQSGHYVWVANGETLRNLKEGSVFINKEMYAGMSNFNMQILGIYNGFLFVETEEILRKGTSFAIGANAGGYGFGKLPSVTYYPDFGSDAGRLQVWKTLFYRGQGPIKRDWGTAAIIVRSKTAGYDYGSLG